MRIGKELDTILRRVSKPARYTGGEWNSLVKDGDRAAVRMALAFPEVYEVGMSNLGLLTLYDVVNRQSDLLLERTFTPWPDMQAEMHRAGLPLYTLETGRSLRDFDLVGLSLAYELNFTNALTILDLAGIPLRATERSPADPLVIAGGSACYNPEPMADFVDLFVIGEGEEVLLELLYAYQEHKQAGGQGGREAFLRRAAQIPGIYVPRFYKVDYRADGAVAAVTPTVPEAPPFITKRIAPFLPALTRPLVPFVETVHDRGAIELMRGCPRACRFCQATVLYRPVRMRPKEEVLHILGKLVANTGYEEISLLSLSSSDYPGLPELVGEIRARYPTLKLSLPSLRLDSFSVELMESLEGRRKTTLTFAPEAGTERLRYLINKRISDENILRTAEAAFARGWPSLKLYFMVGQPGETMEDVAGIASLARQVLALGRRALGRRARVAVSVATFVPKPHSPFQWAPQNTREELEPKLDYLKQHLRAPGLHFSWHDPKVSLLEAVLSRGDRNLGRVILGAWRKGAQFDAWTDQFRYEAWEEAMAEAGLETSFYAHRQIDPAEVLPWDHIGAGSPRAFLRRHYEFAMRHPLPAPPAVPAPP